MGIATKSFSELGELFAELSVGDAASHESRQVINRLAATVFTELAHEALYYSVVDPRQHDAKGNGVDDDWESLTDAIVASRVSKRPINMGDSPYLISQPLDIANVTIIGNPTFIPSGFTTEALTADGTLGAYMALDANAIRGENKITCAALAAVVTPNTIVRITSTADFSASEAGIKQAEALSVRNVIGTVIYFNETLLDSYTTANGAKAAIVTLAKVNVLGNVTVIHSPATISTQTRGLRFKYAQVRGSFALFGCRGAGATFHNNWKDDVRVDAIDNHYLATGTSYGVSLQNATMYGRYRGVISGARHAVSGSGSAHASDSGPGWENVCEFIAHGSVGTIFDCHANVGSIYWNNCVAIAGTIYQLDGVVMASKPTAMLSGARRTYVRNLRAYGCSSLIQQRGTQPAAPLEEVIVDGVHAEDCDGPFINKTGPAIGRLVVKNLSGNLLSDGLAVVNISSDGVGSWEFDNIRVTGAPLINILNNAVALPTILRMTNVHVELPAAAVVSTKRAVSLGTGTGITTFIIRNGTIKNFYYGVVAERTYDLIELTDVDMDNQIQHLLLSSVAVVDLLKMRGGSYKNSRHGLTTQGIVAISAGAVIGTYDVDGIDMDTDPYLVGGGNAVAVALVGVFKSHAGLLGITRGPVGGYLEILSGSKERPYMLRCIGTPNAVVTAPKGAIAQRIDGVAGTLHYVNTDGVTAWTAHA